MWWRLVAGHDCPGGGDAEAARAHPQHSRSAAGQLIVDSALQASMGDHAVGSGRQRPSNVAAAPSKAISRPPGLPRTCLSQMRYLLAHTRARCGVNAKAVGLMSTGATLSEGNLYLLQICMGQQELHNKPRGAVRCAAAILPGGYCICLRRLRLERAACV